MVGWDLKSCSAYARIPAHEADDSVGPKVNRRRVSEEDRTMRGMEPPTFLQGFEHPRRFRVFGPMPGLRLEVPNQEMAA